VIDTLPTASILRMRVYLLDRPELLGYASTGELDDDA
jgi:hypothetical protein